MTIQQEQKSRAITIGAILSIVGSIIAICPLSVDFFMGGYSDNKIFGMNVVRVVVFRLILILLVIVLSIVFLIRNKLSKILASILVILEVLLIGLPFAFGGAQSIGGLFASVFLIMALIGGIAIAIDSFRKITI